MENRRGHVIVVTYPAQGHINPLLQFAKRLASKGLKATLATTHYTVDSIQANSVGIEPISDGFDEGGFKQASSLEAYLESFEIVGSRTLSELVLRFSDFGQHVCCIVYDSLLPWALDVARNFGIHAAVFMTNSASVCSLYWYANRAALDVPFKEEALPVMMPGLPSLGFYDLPSFLAHSGTESPYLALIMHKFAILDQNQWALCNSFEELEPEVVKASHGQWPLVMIGPMVPSAHLDQQIVGDTAYGASLWNPKTNHCLTWLDKRPPNSVVYVSFGSMANLAQVQVEEIAKGLKSSTRNFVWVLKDYENRLQNEFLNAFHDQGLLIEWCNQLEVLSHTSVGCFITHCGWNSTLEGLSLGLPMVGIPVWSDQPMNAKFVEDVWGVGVRAKKNTEGIVSGQELETCLKKVMDGKGRNEFKENASKWKLAAAGAAGKGGSSDQNIDRFISKLIGIGGGDDA